MNKILFVTSLLVVGSLAQIELNSASAVYTQDFNSLASSGTSNSWSQGTTLQNWYAFYKNNAPTTYAASAGTNINDNLYSYGTASVSERALGVQISSSSGDQGEFTMAIHMKNTDAEDYITSIRVQYTHEQWRKGTETGHPLAFYYSIDIGDQSSIPLYVDGWTSYGDLDGLAVTGTGAGATDGNNAANRAAYDETFPIGVPPNTEFWILWSKQSAPNGKTSFGLALDDLTVTATFTEETPLLGLMVDMTTPGDTDSYSENFDMLPIDGSQYYFVDGFSVQGYQLAGWETDVSYDPVLIYQYQTGFIGYHLFPVFSYTDTADNDYKLGFYPNAPELTVAAGFSITNNEASKKIVSFDFGATFSQQYCGGVDTTTLKAYWSVDAASLDDGDATWTQITGAELTSLADCQGDLWLTEEGTSGKHEVVVSATVDLSVGANEVASGSAIYFKFVAESTDTTTQSTSAFNGVAVDDLTIVFDWEDGTTSSTGTSGDPHFYGFQGQKYDVMGQSFEIYNVITAPYLQINSRFTPYYKTATQLTPTGTMMGELGIKFHNHILYANSNSTFVELDGQVIRVDQAWSLNFPGGIVVSNDAPTGKSVLTIETPDIVISFIRKAYYVSGLEPQWHYDYKTRVLQINSEFHGLLGQTWDNKVFHDKEGAFKFLDGEEEDYRILSNRIFGDDFKFNKFQAM